MNAFVAGAALVSVISVAGAQAPADFSGSWQASSGFPARVTIAQTATELTLTEVGGTRERKFTFKLDGSDSRNETLSAAGETWRYVSNARWISSGLLITTKTTRTTLGQSWDSMRILYRDGTGNLHIGTMDAVTDPGPFNAMAFTDSVYKKAAILPPSQAANETRGIYDAVLKEIFNGAVPASFVVTASYRPMYPADDYVWRALGGVPTELREKVAKAAPATPAVAEENHSAAEFAEGAHILPAADVRALTGAEPGSMNDYPAMRQKYGTGSMLSLSKPVGTADGLDVMVHYAHGCGRACGTYGYVWLHRKSRADPWIAKLVVTVRGES